MTMCCVEPLSIPTPEAGFAKPRTVVKRPLVVTMNSFRPARGARIETGGVKERPKGSGLFVQEEDQSAFL